MGESIFDKGFPKSIRTALNVFINKAIYIPSYLLPQHIIQKHHNHKPNNQRVGGQFGAAFLMSFRNNLVADYEQHRSGCERQH